MSRFVHLHLHSHYSLLEALPKTKPLIKAVKERGMDTFALTDNGTLYGAIEAYQKAQDEGVKLIIGMDAYLAKDGRHQKRARVDSKNDRLVLLAENKEGYKNLIRLSSIGFLEGFYYKPRIDKDLLREICQGKAHGLIALSGGYFGEIDQALAMDQEEKARHLIQEYVSIFGEGNFFLELVDRPEIPDQAAINAGLIRLGREMGVPLVGTKNVFYLNPDDATAWKLLQCIKGGRTLEQFERMQQYEYDASLLDGETMEERFKDVPEAIENTRRIADRCQLKLELGKWNFPLFPIPEGETALSHLRALGYEGLAKRVPEITDEMKERLEYELSIIAMKGFDVYLLIVADFINWARENGIVTTTRGSAAGSLVAYATGISDINPIRYQLPFERFLNPERPSAPDIDADFADNRRDEVFQYVCERYGKDKVAQICTFGTMLARGSVRDIGRALGYPYNFVDQVAKLIPMGSQGFPMNLNRALEETAELKALYDTDDQVRRMIDLARRIEGCARHVSVHAAGVVISPTSLLDFTPLQIDTREGKTITQYEMKSVEAAGLVKMDFLGIRNLSILGDAVKLVQKTKGVAIDLARIPLDDKKTFKLLAKGQTMGLFQLNGDGMTKCLVDLQPERVEDIMVMVALYRPGPIDNIDEYIARKQGKNKITYPHPKMESFLDKTYGVLVYQDDLLMTAIHVAGYTWGEVDKFRKAVGKKIPEEMAKQHVIFVDGCMKHSDLDKEAAENLWKLFEPFQGYGFNKAHAASYGMIAYDTAYMKATYPTEYMTALMTAESGDLDTVAEAVKECQRLGIRVLAPDINESQAMFTYIDDQTIRFGLVVIKNLGEEVVACIIRERDAHGPFKDLADFVKRISHRAFNKKSLEALIKSGALERFGERKNLLDNLETLILFHKQAQQEKQQGQASLFELVPQWKEASIRLKPSPPAKASEFLLWERELLGLYLSGHPCDAVEPRLAGHTISSAKIAEQKNRAVVCCVGIITSVKKIQTKKNETMAFVGFEDKHGQMEMVVFPSVYAEIKDRCIEGQLVIICGKVSKRKGEESSVLVENLLSLDEENVEEQLKIILNTPSPKREWNRSSSSSESVAEAPAAVSVDTPIPPVAAIPTVDIILSGRPTPELIEELRKIFQAFPGNERVCFVVKTASHIRRVETDYRITADPSVFETLVTLLGRQNVSFPSLSTP